MYYIFLSGAEFYTKMHRFLSLNRKNVEEVVLFYFFFHWTQFNFKNVPWLNILSYLERCIDWKVVSVSGLFVPKCLK